ncbi:aromatic acid exporter family protein [Spirillospora sp. NPDC047279]|uniref:FUSC family protein n=1 Tax=Spirillospora sp. NPDC047279 TaxID=3155478 RepID=UPI0033C07655
MVFRTFQTDAGRARLKVATETRSTAYRIARLALTATGAYLLALWLLPAESPAPLLAPLTALLVVQHSVYETIKSGIARVAAVTSGVVIALLFAGLVGFSWWSLGLSILAALVIGQVLRLGDHMLEVPISAMLIYALGAATGAGATDRVVETLIGAGLGLVATVVVPSIRVRPAEEAVQDLSGRLRTLVTGMAADLRRDPGAVDAERWLADAQTLYRDIGRTDRALAEAEESVRLNPRARRLIDAGVALRNAVETLEHFTLSLRGLTRALADSANAGDGEQLIGDDEIRERLAETLSEVAASIEAFGRLARSDLRRDAHPADAERELEEHVASARGFRDRLFVLLRRKPVSDHQWPLYGEVVTHLDRLTDQLRAEHRARAREQWRGARGPAARHLAPRQADALQQARARLRRAAGAASRAAQASARDYRREYVREYARTGRAPGRHHDHGTRR